MFFSLVCVSDHTLTNQQFVNCANVETLSVLTPALPCVHLVDKPFVFCPRLTSFNLHSNTTRSGLRCTR